MIGIIVLGAVAALLVVMAIPLLMGKGAWMISGYNMKSPKEKALYDEKAICRFSGMLLLAMAGGIGLMGLGDAIGAVALFYVGLALTIAISIGGAAYCGLSYKRFLKQGVTVGEYLAVKKSSKTSKFAIIATIVLIVISTTGVGALFLFGEIEPTVAVQADSVFISGMYGRTVPFSEITEITLIEQSMRGIGPGRRRNGYALGNTLKGHFTVGLIFVDAGSSPTLHIERAGASDIYISFSDSDATRAVYQELRTILGD